MIPSLDLLFSSYRRTTEAGLQIILHAAYPGISNSQPRPPRYSTIHITHNEIVDELNHSMLAKLSGVTHTFAGYNKVIHETKERQGHHAEDADAGDASENLQNLTPIGFPKANWHSRWVAQ